jgi:hypothetical protein
MARWDGWDRSIRMLGPGVARKRPSRDLFRPMGGCGTWWQPMGSCHVRLVTPWSCGTPRRVRRVSRDTHTQDGRRVQDGRVGSVRLTRSAGQGLKVGFAVLACSAGEMTNLFKNTPSVSKYLSLLTFSHNFDHSSYSKNYHKHVKR